jgi:hypothetical protein
VARTRARPEIARMVLIAKALLIVLKAENDNGDIDTDDQNPQRYRRKD